MGPVGLRDKSPVIAIPQATHARLSRRLTRNVEKGPSMVRFTIVTVLNQGS